MEGLRHWFFRANAPFFILGQYNSASPTGLGQTLSRNDLESNMDQAWELLKHDVLVQSTRGRAQLHVAVYEKSKGSNNPTARTNIEMSPTDNLPQVAGISGIGMLTSENLQAKIQAEIKREKEVWELRNEIAELKGQLNAPSNGFDKAMEAIERIGSTPLGMALIARLTGGKLPYVAAPVPAPGDNQEIPGDADTFDRDLEIVTHVTGVDEVTLMAKLRAFAQNNPEMAKQLLAQQ